ncbi:MAG: alpha-amylase [Ruminococcus sp.]|nr:alpha-amylase [Ruminococcus sp.]
MENKGDENKSDKILKLIDYIPHLKRLGINALYIGPIFQSATHGYDTTDYKKIDSRLGTNEDFSTVAKALKDNGISIVLDGVFNHVGRNFWAFEDVKANRENSPYCSWISGLRFDWNNSYNDGFHYDSWEGHELLVKLNMNNPDVRNHLLDAVEYWIDEWDIDGIRLDAADCIDLQFFRELKQRTTAKKSDFWLMGEIINGEYTRWLQPDLLDSVTNYALFNGVYNSLNSKNLCDIGFNVNREFNKEWGLYKGKLLYNFVDNHDVNRVASMIQNPKDLFNVYSIIYTLPGVPSIYYGSEWGIKGDKHNGGDIVLRPEIDVDNIPIENNELVEHIAKLSGIRSSRNALKYGDYEQVMSECLHWAFARNSEDDTALVFVNTDDNPYHFSVNYRGRQYEQDVEPNSTVVV